MTNDTAPDADGYYGDDLDTGNDELDLSFLDDDDPDETAA